MWANSAIPVERNVVAEISQEDSRMSSSGFGQWNFSKGFGG